ncbi:MAG TPA: hypothetical protein VLJ80_00975 [Solirubrobacteraceae bacterium]|nr:hypothetical protein [Solirubrobacteraceae bacterium]
MGSSGGMTQIGAALTRHACIRCASAFATLAAVVLLALGAPAPASAALRPQDSLIYMPYGLVHSLHSSEVVDEALGEVDSYGIGQLIFATPKVSKEGVVKVPKRNREMLQRWSSRAAAYDAAHGATLQITLVVPAKVKGSRGGGVDLESATVRAKIVAGVQAALGYGISGVQLDFEPYPTSPGYVQLLEELDAMYARVGFHGRFSVAAPANTSRWSPAYLKAVSQLLTQIDPLYYDSEIGTAAAYEAWVRDSLVYYSANAAAATRIVPVLPSYSANRWHSPSVENIESSTAAVAAALGDGSRVNGTGIWWGWGFLYDEEGAYDASADRAAWQSNTVALSFSP